MKTVGPTSVLLLGGGRADLVRGEVVRDGQIVGHLTGRDLELLRFFAARAGTDISRDTLAVEVLGQAPGVLSRAVDSAMFRLRTKIEVDPNRPSQLITLQAFGYRWIAAEPAPPLTNVPPARDEMFGRTDALAELDPMLDRARAATITGPPGIGKTTVALSYARARRFDGGSLLVDLSGSRSKGALIDRVAQVLQVPAGEPGTEGAIGYAVANRGDVLVVLDDAEAVADELVPQLDQWLARAPRSRWLVTSRAPLGTADEQVLALEPLPPPEGRALFVARARAVRTGWSPNEAEDAAVDALVAALDGIPLAIELAASRIGAMSPTSLLERLSLRLLSRPGRDRQATLRAVIEASWDLLSAEERSLFTQLAAFVAPFDRHAARSVVAVDHPDAVLDRLVARSLVARAQGGRFRLLASLAAYADERLVEPVREAVWRRHAAHFVRGARELAADLVGARGAETARRLTDEAPEVRAVVDRFVDRDVTLAAHAVIATRPGLVRTTWDPVLDELAVVLPERLPADAPAWLRFAMVRVAGYTLRRQGRYDEARQRVLAALAIAPDPAAVTRAKADLCALEIVAGRPAVAAGWGEQATEEARAHGDDGLLSLTLADLGVAYKQTGRMDDAHRCYLAALEVARGMGGSVLVPMVTVNLAVFDGEQGRVDLARERFLEGARMHREAGNMRSAGVALMNLGQLADEVGDPELAATHLLEALDVMLRTGSRRFEGVLRSTLGGIYARNGRLAEAHAELDRSLAIARELGHLRDEAVALGERGLLAWIEGDLVGAIGALRGSVDRGAGPRNEAFHRAFLGGLLTLTADPQAEAELARAEQIGQSVGDPTVGVVIGWMRALGGAPPPASSGARSGYVRFAEERSAAAAELGSRHPLEDG